MELWDRRGQEGDPAKETEKELPEQGRREPRHVLEAKWGKWVREESGRWWQRLLRLVGENPNCPPT